MIRQLSILRNWQAESEYIAIEVYEHQYLKNIWDSLILSYFPARTDLFDYKINWSNRRQKRTLASCNIKNRKVTVAKELKHDLYQIYLEPLIYHELCHAALGYTICKPNRKRMWHGKEFKSIEKLHPDILMLNNWIKSGGWRQAVRRDRSSRKKSVFSRIVKRFLYDK